MSLTIIGIDEAVGPCRAAIALVMERGGTTVVTGGVEMEFGRYESVRFIETPLAALNVEPSVNWPAPVAKEHHKPLKRAVLGPKRARWA